ncbi:unnamed protein product [Schistosoma margrebowiei]|uniref:Uncharacterized protein n=1 Tax=Schistosoma margrebowiei TaxID=48269 RepID=A0A183M4R6_9TREM|nr:unnamed protein product [Schistosoma margrebowiei]
MRSHPVFHCYPPSEYAQRTPLVCIFICLIYVDRPFACYCFLCFYHHLTQFWQYALVMSISLSHTDHSHQVYQPLASQLIGRPLFDTW